MAARKLPSCNECGRIHTGCGGGGCVCVWGGGVNVRLQKTARDMSQEFGIYQGEFSLHILIVDLLKGHNLTSLL